MQPHDFSFCCRSLVEAFRRVPDSDLDSTFFLGFDEGGAPFYKLGSLGGGRPSSAFAEPLVFCPFCGSRVSACMEAPGDDCRAQEQPDAEAATLVNAEEATVISAEGEATVLSHDETQEIETVVALRARDKAIGDCGLRVADC